MIEESILQKISSPSLRVYLVWLPILPTDYLPGVAEEAGKNRADPRLTQYWDEGHKLGDTLGRVLALPPREGSGQESRVAWDVYLFYPPGVTWEKEPPAPSYWMHQLYGVPDKPELDGDALREVIEESLQSPTLPASAPSP